MSMIIFHTGFGSTFRASAAAASAARGKAADRGARGGQGGGGAGADGGLGVGDGGVGGGGRGEGEHPPIVVLVHQRAESLRRLLLSVQGAEGADMARVTVYQVSLV
jgi:hypothetical protein